MIGMMNNFLRYIFVMLVLVLCNNVYSQTDRQSIRNGNRLYRQQNYAKAEVEYRKALDKNPNNAQAMYNLGCVLMQQQKDSAAVIQFQNAGKVERGKARKAMVYHNIGVVCQKHQMYSEAIEAYKESLRNEPSDNETRYNLALCKKLLKNQKQKQDPNKDKKNNKDKDKQNQNKNKDKDKQNKKENEQQQQPKDQMSKDNAEQLLNAAMQEEKGTQQRLKQTKQQPRSKRLQKNW